MVINTFVQELNQINMMVFPVMSVASTQYVGLFYIEKWNVWCTMCRSVEFLHIEFKYSLQQDNGRHVVDCEAVWRCQV